MSAPKQVREQSEAAAKFYEELDLGPKSDLVSDGQENVVEIERKAEQPVPEPAIASPSNEPEGDTQEETFEQRYKTLQGMFNTQVPSLQSENRQLKERMVNMEQLISTMQSAPVRANPGQVPAPASVQSLITDEEREEYGDSIDIMRKVTQEVVTPYVSEIERLRRVIHQFEGSVVPQMQHLSQQQSQSAEQNFWSQLVSVVPNWQEINDNPDFQTWLLEEDPLTGSTRQAFLEDAQRKQDARRVAGFFTSWVNQFGGGSEAQSHRTAASSELEKQVSPGRSRTTSASQQGEQKTYTPADIQKFFTDVRTGKYKGKEDQRNRIESDIFAAQAEGRIVQA